MWCKFQPLFFDLFRCSITGHQSSDGREHASRVWRAVALCDWFLHCQELHPVPDGFADWVVSCGLVVGGLVACRMFVRVCCPTMIWADSGVWCQFVKSHGSTMESCCAWQAAVHKFQQTPTVIAWRVMIGSTSSYTIYILNITPSVSKKVFSALLLPSLGKCNFSIALSETIFWSNLYKKIYQSLWYQIIIIKFFMKYIFKF